MNVRRSLSHFGNEKALTIMNLGGYWRVTDKNAECPSRFRPIP